MVTTRSAVEPENLPPTERATFFHSLRVHLQVSQWKHLDLACLNPLDWGWKMENDVMVPIKTDLEAAPDWLLQVIRCKCKSTTKHPCSTQTCSCRKNGLSCVAACGNCHGENCENKAVLVTDEDAYEDEERNIFDLFESFTS